MQVPAISDSAVKIIMARADAFMQLQRRGTTTTIATDRDHQTTARKVRHAGAAKAIAKLRGATLPQVFETWANARASDAEIVAKVLND